MKYGMKHQVLFTLGIAILYPFYPGDAMVSTGC